MRPRYLPTLALALILAACSSAPPAGSPTVPPSAVATSPGSVGPTTVPITPPPPTLSPTPAPTDTPKPTQALTPSPAPTPPGAQTITSDDGLLTIEIPEGALDEPVEISITPLTAAEMAPELGYQATNAIGYRLEPDGLEFNVPVTVTRRLEIPVGADPMLDGVPMMMLASRSSSGEWEWFTDQGFNADLDTLTFTVTGKTTHFSFLYLLFMLWLLSYFYEFELGGPVGGHFGVNGGFFSQYDRDDEPEIDNINASSSNTNVVEPGQNEPFNQHDFQQRYNCVGAGTTNIGMEWRGTFGERTYNEIALRAWNTTVTLNATATCNQ